MLIRCLVFICMTIVLATPTRAQQPHDDAILFIWNDVLMAQSIQGNAFVQTTITSAEAWPTLPTDGINIYAFEQAPLTEPPADDYGFYQGLWSPDHTQFVFLAIEPDGPHYRVISVENEQQQILLFGQVGLERGYLVPVGWSNDGVLILLERYLFHNLREVRLWQYNPESSEVTVRETLPIPDLKGNSASLDGGWVFIGFDTTSVLGYLLNINTSQLLTFRTSFALQHPPPSVFELYPVATIGVVGMSAFKSWSEEHPIPEIDPPLASDNISPAPFLHWPLPDHARSITCYPDSEWTSRSFDVECPGLAQPRPYEGHEGTDIGGKPNGLIPGTPVYAAVRGIVADVFASCHDADVACGDAYGNYVLIEHTRVINHNTQTWFTGYAHLQTVLAEPHTYIKEIGVPIALSGDTGLGGAHLHFEVRSSAQISATNWLDPWDERLAAEGNSLWIGGNAHPLSSVDAAPPPTQLICQTAEDNNIRSGPGIGYEVVAKSTALTDYEVFQVQNVESDQAPGDWYHIRWQESDITGWVWSGLMNDCTPMTG